MRSISSSRTTSFSSRLYCTRAVILPRGNAELTDDETRASEPAYPLYVIESVERGMGDAAEGRTIPHEKVAADLRRKWLTDSAQKPGPKQSPAPEPGAVV